MNGRSTRWTGKERKRRGWERFCQQCPLGEDIREPRLSRAQTGRFEGGFVP